METPLTQAVFTANAGDPSGYLGIPVRVINRSGHPKGLGPKKNKPYFFIPLDRGHRRHCRFYRNGFLDYTVQGTKFYTSLEEWAIDCGSPPNAICFGFECLHGDYGGQNLAIHFRLQQADNHGRNDFMDLERKLGRMDLGIESVAVVIQNRVRMAIDFLGE